MGRKENKKKKIVEQTQAAEAVLSAAENEGRQNKKKEKRQKEKNVKEKRANTAKPKGAKSIRFTLIGGFLIPVLMIIVLGMVSYTTASNTIMEKYEESSLNTITAMSLYGGTLVEGIATRAMEQIANSDMRNYYENYSDNTDEKWIEVYSGAKSDMLQMKNGTSSINNFYTIPESGFEINSLGNDLGETIYSDFKASDIGVSFTENPSKKNGWFGSHTAIDDARGSSGDDYAFTYVQRFVNMDTYIVLDWDIKSAEEMLANIDFGENSICALVSADGKEVSRIYRTDAENNLFMEKIEEPLFTNAGFYQMAIDAEGIGNANVQWNGTSYLYVYAPLGNSGLFLCTLIPRANIIAEVTSIRHLTVIVVVFAALIALLVGTFISGGISRTVSSISASLGKVADGDMTQRFVINRGDEFGALGNTLNNTIDKIRLLMTDMKNFGYNVNVTAEGTTKKTETLNDAIRNILTNIEEVTDNVQSQAAETDKSNERMQVFAGRLDDIYGETSQMSDAIQDVSEAIHKGQIIVNDLDKSSSTTSEITRLLVDNADGVQRHSTEIEGIIDTINNIAEQTNLLSLNASIEAARAGEHGRGFAVVAEEIRKLADMSSKAAGEVSQILSKMSDMTGKTVQSAKETEDIIAKQHDSLNETVTIFGVIEEKVQNLVNGLEVVVNGMMEINADKDEIQNSVQNISTKAEMAAVSTEEVTSSLNEQADVMTELTENMEALRKEIVTLEQSMDRFIIE